MNADELRNKNLAPSSDHKQIINSRSIWDTPVSQLQHNEKVIDIAHFKSRKSQELIEGALNQEVIIQNGGQVHERKI